MGALLNSTGELCFSFSDVTINIGAHDHFTTHLSLKTLFVGGPVIEGEDRLTEVNALIQLRTFV